MKENQSYKWITITLLLFSVGCIAFFWISAVCSRGNFAKQEQSFKEGWYYLDEAGEKKAVVLPCSIRGGNALELFYDGREGMEPGNLLATFGAVYNVEIYADDTLIYQFQDNGREINKAVRGNIVCFAEIPDGTKSQDIHLIYHSGSGKYHLSGVTVSTANDLMKSVFFKNLFCLLISIAMVVMGVLALILGYAMELQKELDRRIYCIGIFLLFCGFWCFSDSAFIQMLAEYSDLLFDLDFYLFMLMPIPLAYFVLCTGNMEEYKSIRRIPFLYYGNIIAQSLLAGFGVFTFFRMLYVTHILMMTAGVFFSLFLLVKEYQRKKDAEVLLSIQALSAVGLLGTVAIFLYTFFNYSTYQMVYQAGLLLLMTILLSVLLKEFVQSVRNRTEAVIYKQLSEQDKLTSLENRRAFDSLLEKIENGFVDFENAALLFLDVNFLKKANDTYGHEFGDTLIIGAAQCIKNVFGSSGSCYRIGGDEFCAVVFDPSGSAEELMKQMQEAINKYNKEHTLFLPLSIAVGCSFAKEEGRRKTVSEWKAEADSRMYEEKKRIKAQRKS